MSMDVERLPDLAELISKGLIHLNKALKSETHAGLENLYDSDAKLSLPNLMKRRAGAQKRSGTFSSPRKRNSHTKPSHSYDWTIPKFLSTEVRFGRMDGTDLF